MNQLSLSSGGVVPNRAKQLVYNSMWWSGIESLADALIETPVMTRDEACEAMQRGIDAHVAEQGRS